MPVSGDATLETLCGCTRFLRIGWPPAPYFVIPLRGARAGLVAPTKDPPERGAVRVFRRLRVVEDSRMALYVETEDFRGGETPP